MQKIRLLTFLIGSLGIFALSSCSPRIDQRGKMPEPEKLAQIKVGSHSKEDVMRLIGSPTNTGAFDDNLWLYLHKTTETVSFLDPKVLEEHMVSIRFNQAGIVEEIRHQDGHGHDIVPVKRVTPAAGQEESPLQQVFGNFGRFSKKGKKD